MNVCMWRRVWLLPRRFTALVGCQGWGPLEDERVRGRWQSRGPPDWVVERLVRRHGVLLSVGSSFSYARTHGVSRIRSVHCIGLQKDDHAISFIESNCNKEIVTTTTTIRSTYSRPHHRAEFDRRQLNFHCQGFSSCWVNGRWSYQPSAGCSCWQCKSSCAWSDRPSYKWPHPWRSWLQSKWKQPRIKRTSPSWLKYFKLNL